MYVIADGIPIKILSFNMTPLLTQDKAYGKGPLAHRSLLFDIHAWSQDRVTGLFFH